MTDKKTNENDRFCLEKVSKSFGGITVLENIDVSILPEETTVLIGPSGCGKSTILKILLGLIPADTGRVTYEGRAIRSGMAEKLRLKFGYVIQTGGLFPHLTAGENATIMTRFQKWDPHRIHTRMSALAEMLHLNREQLDRYPSELSGGQRQRVALMRALMLDPDVLFLDEPLGALDTIVRYKLQDELKDVFAKLKKTVVMVTHDISEAAFFADQIVLINEGKVVRSAPPTAFFKSPKDAFTQAFINARRTVQVMSPEEA